MQVDGPRYVLTTIALLLDFGFSKGAIRKALKGFRCSRNSDVEEFARKRAVNNDVKNITRTYLALDHEAYHNDRIEVLGLVSIALTATDYTKVPLEARRSILGNVPGIWVANSFPGYLIAELGRDDRYTHDDVSGSELLWSAEQIVREAMGLVAGGMIYLDCKDEMVSYYKDLDYEEIYYESATELHKMMKRI